MIKYMKVVMLSTRTRVQFQLADEPADGVLSMVTGHHDVNVQLPENFNVPDSNVPSAYDPTLQGKTPTTLFVPYDFVANATVMSGAVEVPDPADEFCNETNDDTPYTLTYAKGNFWIDDLGIAVPEPTTATAGTIITLPTYESVHIDNASYVFRGWSYDENGTGGYVSNMYPMLSRDVMLYGVWDRLV